MGKRNYKGGINTRFSKTLNRRVPILDTAQNRQNEPAQNAKHSRTLFIQWTSTSDLDMLLCLGKPGAIFPVRH